MREGSGLPERPTSTELPDEDTFREHFSLR